MPDVELGEYVYEQFARITQALSSPKRLRILNFLCQGEKPVEVLAEQAGQSVALVSAHLKVLREARLVESRKEGRRVYYRIANEDVVRFWVSLRRLGESRLPEVREALRDFFGDRESMARVTGADLLGIVEKGEVLLLDLRPADEYAQGHIPGARSVPRDVLERTMAGLPTDREVIAYCRGPYCIVAEESVALLRERGFQAHNLRAGVAEWRSASLPLATGDL